MMLMRTDPFRELDRFVEQVFGTTSRPATMPMDAYEDQGTFRVDFDLPGVDPESIDLNIEKNVLTVHAERRAPAVENDGMLMSERPHGVFRRQLFLGDTLQLDKIEASYDAGVLTVRIPVAEAAKPRRIEISRGDGARQIAA